MAEPRPLAEIAGELDQAWADVQRLRVELAEALKPITTLGRQRETQTPERLALALDLDGEGGIPKVMEELGLGQRQAYRLVARAKARANGADSPA